MARTTKNTKKPPAPTTPALEATKEAHLDPGQFADMDDANLQQLARDMGLDPAAYADREANPLYPVPILWDRKELKEVYRKARG